MQIARRIANDFPHSNKRSIFSSSSHIHMSVCRSVVCLSLSSVFASVGPSVIVLKTARGRYENRWVNMQSAFNKTFFQTKKIRQNYSFHLKFIMNFKRATIAQHSQYSADDGKKKSILQYVCLLAYSIAFAKVIEEKNIMMTEC